MACCGQRRAMVGTGGLTAESPRHKRLGSNFALYEYVGSTAMTVTGSISGLKYRFGQPGAKVQVDRRDILSIVGLPNLRRVAG
jgi:hypothetical protein